MLALDYSGTLCVHERCVRKTIRFEVVVIAGVAGRNRHAKLVWIRSGFVIVVSFFGFDTIQMNYVFFATDGADADGEVAQPAIVDKPAKRACNKSKPIERSPTDKNIDCIAVLAYKDVDMPGDVTTDKDSCV